jgi:xanthine dehydrogenase accessory factor
VREILNDLDRWLERGERFALATVVATRRSAPRPVGSKLAVSEQGEMAGSVSGGCVESDVVEHAREVLNGAPPRLVTYGISDDLALEVGLPCGGEIDVFVELPDAHLVERTEQALVDARDGVLFTVVGGGPLGAKLLAVANEEPLGNGPAHLVRHVDELLSTGRSRLLEHDSLKVFADVLGPPPRLLVFGAVDTAEALCRAANQLGWKTIVADARARFATAERVPSADELIVGWPEDVLERIRPDRATAVVVLTHEDKFDVPAIAGALASDAFYVGALGSRRNQTRRRERLLEVGVAEADLERISGPCGLDIGAETPAETALSILAEILATRVGRGGGPLRGAAGRIHAEVT